MERRNQNQANMQQSINQQAQQQAQAQAQQAQAQQMMMNQNNMQGQVPRPTPQPAQQGFSHLQHQMQASPLPGQQPQQQAPMGMAHQGLPPNMTPTQQQQFQMSMQQNQPPQAQQNVPGRQPNGQQQLSAQDTALVMDLTNRLMAQASEEEKNNTRASLQSRMDPQQFQKYQAQGLDPLFLYYRNQAMHRLRQEKQSRMAQAQAQQLAQQSNIPGGAPMQQRGSMNPSPLNGQTQPPMSMAGSTDFGPFINIESIQQQGILAQEAGQMVVPASGAPRNGTPQPGVMPGQAMNMNDQRTVANPNPRVQQQQQQQMLNAQQMQQQKVHHVAQQQQVQQSQVQARLNAQAKAQQLALQGQPGGMGPMPPQQSPAMGTLNTPLRAPAQQMNSEQPQVNPNAQFGQPLDPRFMQQNQRAQGQANGFPSSNLAATMFASMGSEQQQRLAMLPPDKLSEVVNKWHEQRQQQIAGNLQVGRPQMPMQQTPGQVRPGPQITQPGQFNAPNGGNQFMIPNPGQRTPQNMAVGMNPQQQQLLLQQQIMRQNPIQQRPMPQNVGAIDSRTMEQLDSFRRPTALPGACYYATRHP